MKNVSRVFAAIALVAASGAASAGGNGIELQTTFLKAGGTPGVEIGVARDVGFAPAYIQKGFASLGKAGDRDWAKLGLKSKPWAIGQGFELSFNGGLAHTKYKFKTTETTGGTSSCVSCGPTPIVTTTTNHKVSGWTPFLGIAVAKEINQHVDLVADLTHFEKFAHGPETKTKGQTTYGLGLKFKF